MSSKILIVDDEPEIVDLLKNYFLLEGYDAEGTTSPLQVLRRLQVESVCAVILDLSMPEMSGLDLMREIRRIDGMTHMIVMTGHLSVDKVMMAFRLGACNLFFKPFESLDLLKHEVDDLLAKRERMNQVLVQLGHRKAG